MQSDLELIHTTGKGKGMYEYLFQPSHEFGQQMMQEWTKQYTSHALFLQETQEVVQRSNAFHVMTQENCQHMKQLWKDTKEHPNFLEHYCYLDWQILVHLNQSATTMQCMSVAHILSPIMSFIVPWLFLMIPFVILKLQGLPITFDMYLTILKDIARNHFIGKAIVSIEKFSPETFLYLMFAMGMYGLQMYQNISVCQRFYRNIETIHQHLRHLHTFLQHSSSNIHTFISLNGHLSTYRTFCQEAIHHQTVIQPFLDKLSSLRPLVWDTQTVMEIGYMLTCFYEVHSNEIYEKSIRWCIGLEGYLDNLRGLGQNCANQMIHSVKIHSSPVPTVFCDQIYPAIAGSCDKVTNTCTLDKNMILTGPNASGKTTLLKTTMLNVLFSQQVGYAYCSSASITPYTHLHSYLNIPDTSERDSLFQAEARRCRDILETMEQTGTKARHFCIFDENIYILVENV